MNMNKNLMVSFLAFFCFLFLIAIVSAAPLGTINSVEVNGVDLETSLTTPALIVGDVVTIEVAFNSLENLQDVTVEVEIEGDKKEVEAQTRPFDVEDGYDYFKKLKLEIPFDLADELSGFVTLNVKISRGSYVTENTYTLRVQREAFNADIKSIVVPQTVKAGDIFPVEVVLKNLGYNDLDDIYVTAKIAALDIERTVFFGDLVAMECDKDDSALVNYGVDIVRKCNEDDSDTLNGIIFLETPYDVQSGIYILEVEISNDDSISSETVQVKIENAFSAGTFIVSGNQLLIVNPTNEVVVYRVVPESTNTVSVSVSESVVAVPAGSSRTITVDATGIAGTQTYAVNLFTTDGELVDTVSFSQAFESKRASSPIVVLTIILAIIFIVLLVVLIVLIGKKPEKTEEFGESYY